MLYNMDGTEVYVDQLGWVENPLKADWSDSTFESGSQEINGQAFLSVLVVGYWGDPVMQQWNGVGPSSVPYQMKALVDPESGKIYRPSARRTGYAVECRLQPAMSQLKSVNNLALVRQLAVYWH